MSALPPKAEAVRLADAPSARDFYKNGPSFLNRYLPFWMTSYAQRIIAVLVAVVAIVLPVFSYAPKLYL